MKHYPVLIVAMTALLMVIFGCGDKGRLLSDTDAQQVVTVSRQYLTGVKTDDLKLLQSVTIPGQLMYKLSTTGSPAARSLHFNTWRRWLSLDKNPVSNIQLTPIMKYPEKTDKGYVDNQVLNCCGDPKLQYDTYAIVKLLYDKSQPEALLPLLKIKGKWYVLGMPNSNTRVLRFRSMDDAYNSGKQDWIVGPKEE